MSRMKLNTKISKISKISKTTTDSKTELMKKLFHQHNIHYDKNVMDIYEIWLKNEKPTGNRYKKMSKFIDENFELFPIQSSKPHSDLMMKICSKYNIRFTKDMISSYFYWEHNTHPPGNRYQKMCCFLNIKENIPTEVESDVETEVLSDSEDCDKDCDEDYI